VVTGAVRAADVRHVVASGELATRVLGFRARIGFNDGVAGFASAALREPAIAAVSNR
jgi:dTDP-L-rhamnose 4-epimerase